MGNENIWYSKAAERERSWLVRSCPGVRLWPHSCSSWSCDGRVVNYVDAIRRYSRLCSAILSFLHGRALNAAFNVVFDSFSFWNFISARTHKVFLLCELFIHQINKRYCKKSIYKNSNINSVWSLKHYFDTYHKIFKYYHN